jgi:signal peptidase I
MRNYMNKTKLKKICDIVVNVILYIFLAVCIFAVFITVLSKKDTDGAAEVFGYQMRIVTSESMEACDRTDVSDYKIKDIPLKSMIFVKVMPDDPEKADDWYRDLQVGDVLTFRYVYTTQVTITHRITSIEEKADGGFIIVLEGDNKNSEDGVLPQVIDTSVPNNTNYVIGKVTAQAKWLGIFMSFLMQPVGMILIIMLPCLIIILLQVIKIVRVLLEDRRLKAQAESDKKDGELLELRRRLAELEKNDERSNEQTEDKGGEDQ